MNKQAGFSIIEILIVVAILAFLVWVTGHTRDIAGKQGEKTPAVEPK
jgi:prepilin-type N-terminal cleavage/methylation domain-containing protein